MNRLQRYFAGKGEVGARGSPSAARTSLDGDSRSSGDGGHAVALRDSGLRGSGEAHRLRQSNSQQVDIGDGRPAWGLADDVMRERFQAALSHTEGAWQPITGLTLQLGPAVASAAAAPLQQLAQQQQQQAAVGGGALRPGGAGASAAAGANVGQEPWQTALLGAYAQHLEDGGGAGARATRARLLFQYKPYSQQEPLVMSEAEVSAVVEAVFGKIGAGPAAFREEAASLWDSMAGGAFGLGPSCTTGEVAAIILIKLLMDLYLKAGPRAAFPLALMLFQKPLVNGSAAVKARVFDMLYNLSVHGELLYPQPALAAAEVEAEVRQEGLPTSLPDGTSAADDSAMENADWRATVTSAFRATLAATLKRAATTVPSAGGSGTAGATVGAGGQPPAAAAGGSNRGSIGRGSRRSASVGGIPDWVSSPQDGGSSPRLLGRGGSSSAQAEGSNSEWPPLAGKRPGQLEPASERFQQWLRLLLFRLMAVLAALPEASELAWVAALSCLVHLTTYEGRVVRAYVEDLQPSVVSALLEQCRSGRWSEQLQAWLVTLGANLLYSMQPAGERGGSVVGGEDDRFHRQSSGPESQRSGGGHHRSPSVVGSSYGGAGGGLSAPVQAAPGEAAWWNAARLDHHRLAEFGGLAQVLRCYREAPTQAARRCMFCVIYDFIISGPPPPGRDSWAPALQHSAHASEVAALGAALLRMGAAEAAHPLFVAGTGTPGAMQLIAAAVSTQMTALQAENPGRIVSVPPALVSECMDCLEEICARGCQVPPSLEEAVRYSLDAVTDPGGPPPSPASMGLPPAGDSAVWDCLAGCLGDPSDLGGRVGSGWLLRLLVAAAERELLTQQPAGVQGMADRPPPALLPEVHGEGAGCYLAPGARGLRGQERLRDLLIRVLATTQDSRAPEAFLSAVGSLLAHIRLRCQLAALEQDEELLLGDGTSGAVRRALAAQAQQQHPGHLQQGQRLGSMVGLSSHAGGEEGSAQGSPPVGEGGGMSRDVSQDSLHRAESSGPWQTLDTTAVVLSTLSLAVEWLLQAPEVARQGAMLQAAQILLTFLTTPVRAPHPEGAAAAASSSFNGRANGGAGPAPARSRQGSPDRASQQQREERSVAGSWADMPPSPAQQIFAVATTPASRRSSAHHLRPATAPPAVALAAASPPPAALAGSPSRLPLSGMAQAGARPVTPLVAALDVGYHPATAAAAAAAPAGAGPAAVEAEQLEAAAAAEGAALAAAEAQGTLLWSFLNGLSMVPAELLGRVPPLLLHRLFRELKPDAGLYYDALSAAAEAQQQAGLGAARLTKALDAALGVKGTAQAGRPLYDARAAVLLLLMGRVVSDPLALQQIDSSSGASTSKGAGACSALRGSAFFAGLLSEHDARLRHYAAAFLLRQLLSSRPAAYRRALRAVIARAQQANDEKLLQNPYLQVRAMIDMRLIDLQQHSGGL